MALILLLFPIAVNYHQSFDGRRLAFSTQKLFKFLETTDEIGFLLVFVIPVWVGLAT